MIALSSDCLLFQTPDGQSVPLSAEAICTELMGDAGSLFDSDFVRHAASAVLHYFKHDLRRETVSLHEFANALEQALRGLASAPSAGHAAVSKESPRQNMAAPTDLCGLSLETGCELLFFARLREELRRQLRHGRMLRFRRLRASVRCLTGARRWSPRCQRLEDQIVNYVRECLQAEPRAQETALVIG
jgi:hypothetical protein